MLYKVVQVKNKYFVKNTDTGKKTPAHGYASKAQADQYIQALYANVKKLRGCDFVPVRSMAQPEEIEGYLALWGSPDQRDCYGTYFNQDDPPLMDLEFVPFPLRYGHGSDPEIGAETVGRVVKVWLDDTGIKFRALLDKASQFYQRVASEIQRGSLGISTGTNDYLAEFNEDGQFVTWPIGSDVSLTDKPCEFRMPAVAAVRSLPDGQHIQLEVKPIAVREAVTEGDPRDCGCDEQADAAGQHQRATKSTIRNKIMANKARAGFPPAKPAAKPPVKPAAKTPPPAAADDEEEGTTRGGLTLQMLGLDNTATPADVYEAVCELLGDAAAQAYYGSFTGGADEEDELEEVAPSDDEEMLMREDPDPEKDTRPEDTMGDDPEDITDGRSMPDMIRTLEKMLAQQKRTVAPRSAKRQVAPKSELAKLQAEVKALKLAMRDAPIQDRATGRQDRRDNGGNQRTVTDMRDLRYDYSSAADLSYACKLLYSVHKTPSDALVRATSWKIAQEIEKSTPVGSDMTVQYMAPFRSVSDVRSMDVKALRTFGNKRTGEVMGDGNSGFGSNYVGVFYDTSLWLKLRAMPIWRELEARGMEEKVIPVGYASDVIPLEGADFSWYRVPETVDVDVTGRPKINIPQSKSGTSSTTLTVRTLGALVYYSVLLEEDSIVPMASELNRKAQIESQEQIEYVLFNGDTATGTGNLNLKNGTVNASDVNNFTVADGFLKAAIIGNSGLNARQSGAFSDLDFQLLFGLLGTDGIAGSALDKLLFVIDPLTGIAADRLPIFKTNDVSNIATLQNGHVKEVYGVPVYRSGQMKLADSTGYIDSVTAANNKYGRILLARPDQWVIGFKRQVTMEYFRDVPGQSNGMVITLRLGLQNRDATVAAAASYGVPVK